MARPSVKRLRERRLAAARLAQYGPRDYYGLGYVNRAENGMSYGVISVNSLAGWVMGESEPIYPDTVETQCTKCKHSWQTDNLCPDDYQTCPECEHEYRDRSLDMLEPIGWDCSPGDDTIKTEYSESLNCLYIVKSPYFTFGRYCSPCCPGAVDLDNPDKNGAPALCPGHDWFEDGKAPYPVYLVATGERVTPEKAA